MKKLTIKEIKILLANEDVDDLLIDALRIDERVGVQKLIKSYDNKLMQVQALAAEFQLKKEFDRQFNRDDQTLVAGVDEAGRGPLAGPVVVAAVILPDDFYYPELNDSKQLSADKRNELYDFIIKHAIDYKIITLDNKVIDQINILEATKQAMKEAINQLTMTPFIALIDAVPIEHVKCATHSIVKGDAKSLAIAAASILAKVTRDRIMDEIATEYPQYNFSQNKGYGTKDHIEALCQHGPSPYHRLSFSPVQAVIK